jgi:hypothetical protein
LTAKEAQTVYDKIQQNEVLKPIHFAANTIPIRCTPVKTPEKDDKANPGLDTPIQPSPTPIPTQTTPAESPTTEIHSAIIETSDEESELTRSFLTSEEEDDFYAKFDIEDTQEMNLYQSALLNEPPTTVDDIYHEPDPVDDLTLDRKDFSDMCNWSIFSDKLQYVSPNNESFKRMSLIAPVDRYNSKQYKSFAKSTYPHEEPTYSRNVTKEEYTDVYENVTSDLKYSQSFNEGCDIGTTYLGRDTIKRSDKLNVEEHFRISCQSYTKGTLFDKSPIKILMDTGATKSFMSLAFYKGNVSLQNLPKLSTHCKTVKVGNGQRSSILFVVPVIVTIGVHRFEMHTLVADIDDDVDIIFGMKDMHEVEGNVCTRDNTFQFINRSLPLFPMDHQTIMPNEQKFIKTEAPFLEEISGIALVKVFDGPRTADIKLKVCRNKAMLQITNLGKTKMVLHPDHALGLIDLRSLGYFKIDFGQLEEDLKEFVHFESLYKICEEFNKCNTNVKEKFKETITNNKSDPFPWLDAEDERRNMTDEEILNKFIDLSKADLDNTEKDQLIDMLCYYKQAFSLRDEIGECPAITIDIDVLDKTDFFVRPFPIAEGDKPSMDKQMRRLVSLGILTKNSTSHTSPVMLISRKLTKDKRAITDLRLLNSRIRRKNITTVLIRDLFNILGNSKCEMMSVVDIKDAFHSLKLGKESKEYCGILPYFGSPHYRYEVLPMGLSISPAVWMAYVNFLLESIQERAHYIAIMDDLLIHSLKDSHMDKLEVLLETLIKHGLKLSPKKCQLCLTELVYMGNVFTIKNQKMQISPIKSRIEAMLKIPNPRTPRQCKSFCGVVNYLSLFCPELQKLLAPIYALTRRGCPFKWKKEHQDAFEEIKKRLTKPPVLHLPVVGGRFILYTDTSRKFVGSALWQVQEGTPKIVGYASKTLHKACENYSVTELEMQGLLISIQLWQHFLHNTEFDCAVDHQAAVQIMKSKLKPATNRISRLIEHLNQHSFNLYYVKGKDLILSDFLSRVRVEEFDDPYDLTPIACPMDLTEPCYYRLETRYKITTRAKEPKPRPAPKPPPVVSTRQTRGSMRAVGKAMPSIKDQIVNPHVKPEHQPKRQCSTVPLPVKIPIKPPVNIPPQEIHRKPQTKPIPQKTYPIKKPVGRPPGKNEVNKVKQPAGQSKPLSGALKQQYPIKPIQSTDSKAPKASVPKNTLKYSPNRFPDNQLPTHQPPIQFPIRKATEISQKTPTLPTQIQSKPIDFDTVAPTAPIDLDIGGPENEEFDTPSHIAPTKAHMSIPPCLADQVDQGKLFHKFMPKQKDIDKLLREINKKILRETHLTDSLKDIQAAYVTSPQLRDIYIYLLKGKLPPTKKRIDKVHQDMNYFMILDTLLFRVTENKHGDYDPVLCIPTSKVDILLQHYHTSPAGGHSGVTKCYMTITKRFYCPNLAHHVRAYIAGCHICQMFKLGKKIDRPFHRRINLNVPAFTKISMDIKHMPNSTGEYKYFLLILCEISNFIVVMPLTDQKAPSVCKAIMEGYIRYFGAPSHIMMDEGTNFLANITQYFTDNFGIKLVTISPTNHKSLLAEHGIKSISNIIMKHLEDKGDNWTQFLHTAMLCYNTFTSPNLDGLSPFELAFGRKAKIIPQLEVQPDTPITGTHREYHKTLQTQMIHLRNNLQKIRNDRTQILNEDKDYHFFNVGQLVYLWLPKGAILQAGSRKIACSFVGPLVVYKAISPNQFILMSLDGFIYPHLIEETRMKPGIIRTSEGNVSTLAELKHVIRLGIKIEADPPQSNMLDTENNYPSEDEFTYQSIGINTPVTQEELEFLQTTDGQNFLAQLRIVQCPEHEN